MWESFRHTLKKRGRTRLLASSNPCDVNSPSEFCTLIVKSSARPETSNKRFAEAIGCWRSPNATFQPFQHIRMPLARASLRSFLHTAKSTLNNDVKQHSPVTFVVGNESAGQIPIHTSNLFSNPFRPRLSLQCRRPGLSPHILPLFKIQHCLRSSLQPATRRPVVTT